MFRLFATPPSAAPASATGSAASRPANPQLLGETRTILSHLLVPPEEKGLTLHAAPSTCHEQPTDGIPAHLAGGAAHAAAASQDRATHSSAHSASRSARHSGPSYPSRPATAVSREQSRETSPVRTREDRQERAHESPGGAERGEGKA